MTEEQAAIEALKEAGVDYDALLQESQGVKQEEKTKTVVTQMKDVLQGTNEAPAQGITEKLGKGAAIGLMDVVRNVYNGGVSLANYAEDFAASKGLGSGDLITEATKWENPYKDQKLDTETEVARRVVQYATPVLGGLATSGIKAGLALEAAYSFFAIDPDEQRVSDLLKDTRMAEVPIASEIIDSLSTKPDDTEIESRLKNLAEGMGLAVPLTGMVWGAGKVYAGLRKAKTEKLLDAAVAEKQAAKMTPAEVDASDLAISKPQEVSAVVKVEENDLPLFEKEWKTLEWDQPAVKVEADAIKLNLSDDNIVDFFNNIARSTDDIKKYRGPISDVETKQAVDLMRKNPAVVEKVARWTPDQGALTSEELLVSKYILAKSDEALTESILKAEIDSSPEMQVKVQRDFDNYLRIKQIEQGVGSEGGRVLRANQILGSVSGLGDKEAMKQLGAQGRKKMYDRIIEKYGGVEGVKKNLEKVKLIQELAKVAKTPDEAFTVKMDEVAVLSTMDKVEDAVTKVALNGMLSSPVTWARAFGGNLLMTSKNLVDNYLSVGIGKTRELFGGVQSAMSLAEANARFKAGMYGIVDGFIPAAKSFANKKSPLYGTAKFEIASDVQKIPDLDDVGVKQGWEWVNDNGVVVNALTAGETPRRALIAVDTYFSHMNFKSNLAGELVQLQAQGKFLTPQEIDQFWQAPHKYAPQAYYRSRTQAGVSTFSNTQIEGTLGYNIVNGVEKISDSVGIPFKRVITPFLNTSVNIARATEEMTPLAFLRSNPLIKRGSLYRELEKGGRNADVAMAKLASGTSAIIATMYLLDSDSLVPGYASLPDQRSLNKAFPPGKDIPAGPAIKVGEKFYSLQGLEPFSTLINAAARLKTMSGLVSDEEYADAANTFRLLVQDAISPEEYAAGLSDIVNIISGDTDPSKTIANMVTRFVPYSGALGTAKRITDPNMRDATPVASDEDGPLGALQEFATLVTNRIKARAPMMSGDLPMMRNYFGRAVKIPDGLGPDFMSPIASSDGRSLKLKRGLENLIKFSDNYSGKVVGVSDFNISMPSRIIEIPIETNSGVMGKPEPYQMTPEEYSDFLVIRNGLDPMTGQLLAGRSTTLENRYYEILERYNMFDIKPKDLFNMNDVQVTRMYNELKQVTNVYNNAAELHMIGKYADGAIANRMREKTKTWNTKKIPGIE